MSVYITNSPPPERSVVRSPVRQTQCRKARPFELTEPDWQRRDDFWQEYRLRVELGSGNSGQVYLVENQEGDYFALKVFNSMPSNKTEFLVQMALNQSCDWFVKYYGLYLIPEPHQRDKMVYAVLMEYVPGGQADALDLDREQVKGIAIQLLCQLACMHGAGFLHRDIKPANVLIDVDNELIAHLADFGVACTIQPKQPFTSCERPEGDRVFVAPELWPQQLALPSVKSDIWSLGLTLFMLLDPSIAPPFVTDSLETWKKDRAYILEEAAKLSDQDELESLIKGMMSLEPAERPTAEQALALIL